MDFINIKRIYCLIFASLFVLNSWFYNFTHEDKARFMDFARMAQEDVTQTIKGVHIDKTHREDNPLIKGFVENNTPPVFRAASIAGLGILADRWSNMKDPNQRRIEMILGQLVEAAALHYSKEPWRMTVYATDF